MDPHPRAALVVLQHDDGRVLAISRGDDVWDWGFPGGTADPQDITIADTAFRELLEETGVVASELALLHREHADGHVVTTFVATQIHAWPAVLRSDPFEGYVDFVDPKTLVAPTCRYRKHAKVVLKKAGIL
jgi:8-oxo-dGTP pyrophosphatase MutT (NUDIX family)